MDGRLQCFDNFIRDANLGDDDLAAEVATRHQKMTRLLAEERHRPPSLNDRPIALPRRAVEPARNIDGDHRDSAGVHRFNEFGRFAIERTRKSGAEERVDHDIHALQRIGRCRANGQRPAARHLGGVALQCGAISEKEDADVEAAIAQMTGRDEAVAAVVAGAAEHDDAGARAGEISGEFQRRFGDVAARVFHQIEARDASRCGQTIRLGHLRRRQKFVHAMRSILPQRRSRRRALVCRLKFKHTACFLGV